MKNWLEIAVGIYLVCMVLYGHHKGFIRLAVSVVALIGTLVIVNVFMPQVSSLLKENTQVMTWIESGMEKVSEFISEEGLLEEGVHTHQHPSIEGLKLPQEIKDILTQNNNNEVYQMLGVEQFTDYIGNYLANITLNLIGFILSFIVVYLVIRLLMRWLDLVTKLPVLSGLNKLAGGVMGGVQGLLYVWIGCLCITASSGTAWASALLVQIEASTWLTFLYHYNVVTKLFFAIIQGALP